jgi:structural maintenance of chromosome 2
VAVYPGLHWATLQALGYDAEAMQQLSATKEAEAQEVRRCKDRVGELASMTAGLNFRYSDPDRNFDRSKVKGPLARLFRVSCAGRP